MPRMKEVLYLSRRPGLRLGSGIVFKKMPPGKDMFKATKKSEVDAIENNPAFAAGWVVRVTPEGIPEDELKESADDKKDGEE